MSLSAPVHAHTHKAAGTCPHGLPLGACPICNGMAGGNSTTKRDTPRNVGEMTYNQCAAIGAMLRAQKNAKAQAKAAEMSRADALMQFQKAITNTHNRLMQLNAIITNNLPPVLAKPIVFVLNTIIGNVLKLVSNLPVGISNIIQTISQKLADISDKLAAIKGEIMAAVNERISKFKSEIKKKLKSMFFIFSSEETDDEDKKIDEAKRTFELKTFIHKLYSKIKGQENNQDEH